MYECVEVEQFIMRYNVRIIHVEAKQFVIRVEAKQFTMRVKA